MKKTFSRIFWNILLFAVDFQLYFCVRCSILGCQFYTKYSRYSGPRIMFRASSLGSDMRAVSDEWLLQMFSWVLRLIVHPYSSLGDLRITSFLIWKYIDFQKMRYTCSLKYGTPLIRSAFILHSEFQISTFIMYLCVSAACEGFSFDLLPELY